MRERIRFYPLRGFSPYRDLARRLRAEFAARDEAKAAAAADATAPEPRPGPETLLAVAAGVAPPPLSKHRRHPRRRP